MAANLTCSPDFTVTYDPAANLLAGHWPTLVEDQQLRAHYADLLTAACAHGNCRFWLLDMRQRNWHARKFGQWYNTTFAQAAQAALRQPVFIAYVLDPAHYTHADAPAVQTSHRICTSYEVYPFYFDSETAAREWLLHQQALDG